MYTHNRCPHGLKPLSILPSSRPSTCSASKKLPVSFSVTMFSSVLEGSCPGFSLGRCFSLAARCPGPCPAYTPRLEDFLSNEGSFPGDHFA